MNIDRTVYPIKILNANEEHLKIIKEALGDIGQEFEINEKINNSYEINPIGHCVNLLFDIDALFDFSLENIVILKAFHLGATPLETHIHCAKNELLSCLRLFLIQWGFGDWGGTNLCDLRYINGDCYYFYLSGNDFEELGHNTDIVLKKLFGMNKKVSYILFSYISNMGKFKVISGFCNKVFELSKEYGYDRNSEIQIIVINFIVDFLKSKHDIPIFLKFEDDLSDEQRRQLIESRARWNANS